MGTVHRTETDDDRRPDGYGPPFSPVTYLTRHILRALTLAAVALLGVGTGSAMAAPAKDKQPAPCWKTLINDWYDGRIDGTYPIHCYRDALKKLPTDVDTYSSARDDIKQALQKRITQSHGSGTGGTSSGGSSSGSGTSGGGTSGGSSGGSKGSKSGTKSANGSPIKTIFDKTKPGNADSVPLPLIVLGAVAALLMVAGGVGFLARRTRTRKLQLGSLPPTSPEAPSSQP